MGNTEKTLENKISKLSPESRREVEELVESLLSKQGSKTGTKLKQTWSGALREFRDKYTSLELQKKALEWRGMKHLTHL
jgi:hypothetical protein